MDGNEASGFAQGGAAPRSGSKGSSAASWQPNEHGAAASSPFAGSSFAGSDGGGAAAEPAGPPTSDPAAYAQHPSGEQQQQQQQQLQQQQPVVKVPLSLRELRSFSSLSRRAEQVWGCLRPAPGCKGQLPFVLLQGRGVAVGRGRDAYNERLSQLALSRASSLAATSSMSLGRGSGFAAAAAAAAAAADGAAPPPTPTARRRSSEGGTRGCTFVEVADGRVSRVHAVLRYDALRQQALLEDLSSNGTYVNGERVGKGCSMPLADGDRISLVLSVAPLAEQAWVFHTGDPRGLEGDIPAIWTDDSLQGARRQTSPVTPTAGVSASDELPSSRSGADVPGGSTAGASVRLARTQTSSYSTKDAITLEDLQCQICLCTLRDCVALEPCGHNYCAACLSHHFAALLRGGQPLACPMRCAPPQRVVANTAVRQLLAHPGALLALAPSLRRSSLQQPLGGKLQRRGSSFEPLPEVQPASSCSSAGGSGSSGLPPGSCLPSMGTTPTDSLRAQAAAKALLVGSAAALNAAEAEEAGAPAAAAGGSRPSSAGSAAASSEAESPSSTASEYRHVVLRPGSAAARPLATPPPSPFLSFAPSRRFGSLHSGDLDDPGLQAPVALPGAPTMQAASPLAAAATAVQPDTAGPTALPGEETMRAIAPLGTAASEPSVQGPMALPGEPTLAADSPFVLQSGSLLRQQPAAEQQQPAEGVAQLQQQHQQHQQQHQPSLEVLTEEPLDSLEGAAAETGEQGAVASSVGSVPELGSWAALAAQLNVSAAQRQAAGSGSGAEQPAAGGAPPPAAGMQPLASAASAAAGSQSTEGEEAPLPMHPLCPLDDSVLPLETSNLKTRQLRQALDDVLGSQTAGEATGGLEALARLTWSDEASRLELVQGLHGTERVAAVMEKFRESDSVQCTGCLALLALLRGEGPAADAARGCMEDGAVIGTIAEGMKAHPRAPMVQLSALLCLVPLALNHGDMQMKVARLCLPSILAAIQQNPAEFEVVAKGLILLGVLGQGDEEGHEAIRNVIVQRTLFPQLAAAVLEVVAPESEDVLWSALFVLAVVARDTSSQFVVHMLALVRAGVLPALEHALAAYRSTMDAQEQEPDEMICRAGEYLVIVLTQARRLLWLRRSRRLWQAGLLGVVALAAFRWLRTRAGHRAGGGRGGVRR